ncbi:hypothetical protein HD806DRAFT_534944 [Xylariaceae sp. AK1471]|nr:hypothetical protein HD806DRAFT_534944 [Xylariaceae sp. AK1471]
MKFVVCSKPDFSEKAFVFLNPDIIARATFLGRAAAYALGFAQFITTTVLVASVQLGVLFLMGSWLCLFYGSKAIWTRVERELRYWLTDITDFFTVVFRTFIRELA